MEKYKGKGPLGTFFMSVNTQRGVLYLKFLDELTKKTFMHLFIFL